MKKDCIHFGLARWQVWGALLLSGMSCGVLAADDKASLIEPGLWEVVSQPRFPNAPIPVSPKNDMVCLTADDIAAGRIPVRLAPHCQIQGGVAKGKEIEFKVDCGGIPAAAKITANERTFSGQGEMQVVDGKEGEGRVTFYFNYSGRRLSDCLQDSSAK